MPSTSSSIEPASLTVTSKLGVVTLVRSSPVTPESLPGSSTTETWPGTELPETTVVVALLCESGTTPAPSRTICDGPDFVATVAAARNGLPCGVPPSLVRMMSVIVAVANAAGRANVCMSRRTWPLPNVAEGVPAATVSS